MLMSRLARQDLEDTEYQAHLKKLGSIQNRKPTNFKSQSLRLPPLNGLKNYENEYHDIKGDLDHWNPLYDRQNNRKAFKGKFSDSIQAENERLRKKLKNVKGSYDSKKWDKDYEEHLAHLKITSKKFYTPRGVGHRKSFSLPEVKTSKKNTIKLLNEAVNQLERGDVVLMKTLINLNYYERMETRKKYEKTYDSDLKKGLVKVMDKEFEPLINALLTDMNLNDAERIYESLYEPSEAATVITEALLSRNLVEREALLETFEQKIESDLITEVENKIDDELKYFLIALIHNEDLDDDYVDEEKCEFYINEFESLDDSTESLDLLTKIIETSSVKQFKYLFREFKEITGIELYTKFESDQSVSKALKLIQSLTCSPEVYRAAKLHDSLKSDKSEFLRLLAIYSKTQLELISSEYEQEYDIKLENDIRLNFDDRVARLVVKLFNQSNEIENF